MEEHRASNATVAGSIPAAGTKEKIMKKCNRCAKPNTEAREFKLKKQGWQDVVAKIFTFNTMKISICQRCLRDMYFSCDPKK